MVNFGLQIVNVFISTDKNNKKKEKDKKRDKKHDSIKMREVENKLAATHLSDDKAKEKEIEDTDEVLYKDFDFEDLNEKPVEDGGVYLKTSYLHFLRTKLTE